MATIGDCNFVLNRWVALSQGLICTIRVHLGLSKVAYIRGVSSQSPHVGGKYKVNIIRKISNQLWDKLGHPTIEGWSECTEEKAI